MERSVGLFDVWDTEKSYRMNIVGIYRFAMLLNGCVALLRVVFGRSAIGKRAQHHVAGMQHNADELVARRWMLWLAIRNRNASRQKGRWKKGIAS